MYTACGARSHARSHASDQSDRDSSILKSTNVATSRLTGFGNACAYVRMGAAGASVDCEGDEGAELCAADLHHVRAGGPQIARVRGDGAAVDRGCRIEAAEQECGNGRRDGH